MGLKKKYVWEDTLNRAQVCGKKLRVLMEISDEDPASTKTSSSLPIKFLGL